MDPTLPITIRRSVIPIILWVMLWFGINALLYWGVANAGVDGQTKQLLAELSVFVSVISFLALLVVAYVYWQGMIIITETTIKAVRYKTLFWDYQSSITFKDIEEVTINQGGLLKALFGVGSILVQTSSAQPYTALNWIPRVTQWRDYIAARADPAD